MTKLQVENIAGAPNRILAVNETDDGYQEVLEYSTSGGELYALEFWNDYLTGYEYIDSEVNYVPVAVPPPYYPDYGHPIVVIPGRPNRPQPPANNNRPPATRPPSGTSRPPATRPPSSGTRPPQNPAPSRPTTKPAQGSRPVGTPPSRNTGSSSSSNTGRNSGTRESTAPQRSTRDVI